MYLKGNSWQIFSSKEKSYIRVMTLSKISDKYFLEYYMEDCSSRLIYLERYEDALKVTKQVSKDGNDGESIYLYLVTNDIDLTTNKILEIYKRRWKIEEYHKSLKQNLKIEHSPTKVETSQLNHVYLCVCGFIRLEQMRLYEGLNHFAIKERIYLQALNTAYQEVEKLKCA